MDSVGVKTIEMAALGRPFQLGMLYDCRKDALIPGITLWNQEELQKSIQTRPQINTDFKVTASDSMKEKSKLMNIGGSLNLSILGGLISVSGSAKYLKDTKMTFNQQRLTLRYHSTSKFEELTMNHLAPENIVHHQALDKDMATHVVTAVLYGADACFVFDREVSSDEDKTTVKGEAKVAFEKLTNISPGVSVNLKMNDAQKNAVKKFNCTFYGDFQLPSNPTSFEDALKVFTDLPKLLGENREVPVTVWLFPLDKLLTKTVKLQKEISMNLITKTESVYESLSTAEMKCNDLLKDSPAEAFTTFHDKIQDMKQNCSNYKLSLMEKLGSLLPSIRGDMIPDTALTDLLKHHDESPFRGHYLEQWLEEREKESDVIKTLLRQLNDSGVKVENNLEKNLMDLQVKNLVSYTFTSLNWSDELLHNQMIYPSPSTNEDSTDSKQKSWLTSDIRNTMRKNLKIFKSLIDSKDRKSAKFIVSSKEMKDTPGSCILLYKNGRDEAVCFSPPSKPACPVTEEVKADHVVLKVSSSSPDTVELRLMYKMKHEKDWTSQTVLNDQHTVTVTDLRAGTEYQMKCAAVGKLDYTIESDVIRVITEERNRRFMGYSGLIDGESSSLNSVLQTLYMTKEFREHLETVEIRDDDTGSILIEELKTLFSKLDTERGPVSTTHIKEMFHHEIDGNIRLNYSKHCLYWILSKNELSEIFKYEITAKCLKCNRTETYKERFNFISLDPQHSQDLENTLQEYIRQMTDSSQSFCDHCKNTTNIETTTNMIQFPKILILCLKRLREERNSDEVIIRPQIKVSSDEYELYAIINHYGTIDSGYYNADIKCTNQQWHRFNESHVSESPLDVLSQRNEGFRSSAALILMYRRIE
ncbi:cytolytic toxin-alpha-like isoform X2 [Xyrauchen texanus]|uniref:cytolytic toxin-alpha-like isoform X2 n=1 Tax=Xyrauchen texanus TaxID=154827 RepID=UPI00224282EB|nr:cytolytic toxin-alpha-like isoform X2 [Xyrauchen texanus]